MRNFRLVWGIVAGAVWTGSPVLAWDCAGHRMITLLALDALPPNAPAFLREEETRVMIASEACEPDRWRTGATTYLQHENEPDHFLNVEDLEAYGLTLETMPRLRYEYVAAMAEKRVAGGAVVIETGGDAAKTHVWPGFAPYAVMEHYAKLRSSVRTLRTLEKVDDPDRAPQMALARANVVCEMGLLSHFVGDLAQPLHTTKHHNGWVGKNPRKYTTDKKLHAKIDGGAIAAHRITYESMLGEAGGLTRAAGSVNEKDPWDATIAYIKRSHEQVEPLYELEQRKGLETAEGKAFIEERLRDAAGMLGALYRAAFEQPKVSEKDARDFVRYDGPAQKSAPAPVNTPAAPPPPPATPESAPESREGTTPGGGG